MYGLKMGEEYRRLILELAARKGIDPEYSDIWGQVHPVPQDTQKRILAARGLAVDNPEDLKKTLGEEDLKEWKTLTDSPQILSQDALPSELVFRFPVSRTPRDNRLPEDFQVQLRIIEERGRVEIYGYPPDQISLKETREIRGQNFIRGTMPFPQGLPLGFHKAVLTLISEGSCLEQVFIIVICPPKTFLPEILAGDGQGAGVAVALASLRSARNWGVGDLGDLRVFVRWAAEVLGVDSIGLLPLHALTNQEPYNISPYYPSSRFYRNPIYLTIPEIEEYGQLPGEGKEKLTREEWASIKEAKESEQLRFQEVWQLKDRILRRMFHVFLKLYWKAEGQETRRQKEFKAYIHREGKLLDLFALFNALQDHFQRVNPELSTWGQWPASFQDPDSVEVKFFEETHWQEVLFHKYLQWQLEEQLAAVQAQTLKSGARIGLYFDLALGVDPWGADAWAWRDFFVSGFRVGAPPDEYSPKGQEWGFYPPNPERYRQGGYRFLSRQIRCNSRYGGALRIDHILQFARLFWIYEGELPKEGAYVKYDLEDYLKVLALESVRNKTLIIGEDLGTVPDYLREASCRYGIFSYRLLYFERNEEGRLKAPTDYPALALATISTHDLPPIKGFWTLKDLRTKKDLDLYPDPETFHRAMIGRIMDKRKIVDSLRHYGFLSQDEAQTLQAQDEPELTDILYQAVLSYILCTRSKLAMVSLEDIFGVEDQFNLPGTTTAYPNWSKKLPFSIEDIGVHPALRKKAEAFRRLTKNSGRSLNHSQGL